MKKKVLFVDDEPNVLNGLRRMLRPLQAEWMSGFAEGGAQALAVLEREPFDIIVSDMRMPGMSGAQLLDEVGRRFPRMARIILTGQCDEESGLRALRVAHQMLYKPCEADSLKTTVATTCTLGDWLVDETLQALVARQTSLPSAPAAYRAVHAELRSEAPSLERVAAIIGRDVGMVAKILHVVNSSFFGLRREILDPKEAVMLLGLETMKTIVLTTGIFFSLKEESSLPSLQTHSRRTGALARMLATTAGADVKNVEYAALAGLLHKAGQLVLLNGQPDKYAAVLDQAVASHELCRIEHEVFRASHAEVGACLLGLWGLPRPVVDAVAWHRRPSECPTRCFGPLTAVHVANALLSENPSAELDRDYLQSLQLLDRLPDWEKLAIASQERNV